MRNSPEENWSIKQSIHGIFPMRFLGRTGENRCSKQREERTRKNEHGNQRGTEVEKMKKREEVGYVTSQKPARYLIKYSRIDVIT